MLTVLFVLMAISFVFTYLIVVRPVDFFTNQKQNNNNVQHNKIQVCKFVQLIQQKMYLDRLEWF